MLEQCWAEGRAPHQQSTLTAKLCCMVYPGAVPCCDRATQVSRLSKAAHQQVRVVTVRHIHPQNNGCRPLHGLRYVRLTQPGCLRGTVCCHDSFTVAQLQSRAIAPLDMYNHDQLHQPFDKPPRYLSTAITSLQAESRDRCTISLTGHRAGMSLLH